MFIKSARTNKWSMPTILLSVTNISLKPLTEHLVPIHAILGQDESPMGKSAYITLALKSQHSY